jgi:hypothetical protein
VKAMAITRFQFWEYASVEDLAREAVRYNCALVAREDSLAASSWLVTVKGEFDDLKAFYCERKGVDSLPDWEIDLQGESPVCVLLEDDDEGDEFEGDRYPNP